MKTFLGQRAVASAISLVGLVVLVFFLSRLTGDPTSLYLPLDASLEAREQFRELHGLNDPLIVQFGRYFGDLVQFDFGMSIRRNAPAIDVVLQAFVWTLWLAVITMTLVTTAAIVFGSLAAFRVGGAFDRIATFFSLIGASAPDFWIAIVAIVLFAVNFGWLPTSGTGTVWHWVLPVAVLVHPALRAYPSGRPGFDDHGAVLGLRQDGAGQGRAEPADHLRPRAAQRDAAGHHRDRRPGGGAAQWRGGGRDASLASRAWAS